MRAAVESVGLKDYLNTSYGIGLLATLAERPERYAIIDVGTNSVKFHIAERRPDGTFARVKDRAEITRIGEGIDETGTHRAASLWSGPRMRSPTWSARQSRPAFGPSRRLPRPRSASPRTATRRSTWCEPAPA